MPNDPTYVERLADHELYQELLRGNFCYVLTPRQMGKSSLRVRTQRRLQKEGLVCISVDLSSIGKVSEEQWFRGITYRLLKSFKSPKDLNWQSWWKEHDFLSPSQLLRELIDELLLTYEKEEVVIFFDEIDTVLGLNFNTDDFFSLIRACYNSRVDDQRYQRLTFCLLGVASPIELIKDNRCTPFNIGTSINLTGFQFEEASKSLLYGLKKKVQDPKQILSEVLYWTGGQPFLTQKLCYLIVNHLDQELSSVKAIVTKYIIENWEANDNPTHFRALSIQILGHQEKTIALLNFYKGILIEKQAISKHSPCESTLMLAGLISKYQNKIQVSNPIYVKIFNLAWIEEKLEETWQSLRESGKADDVVIIVPGLKETSVFLCFCLIVLFASFLSLWSAYQWFSSEPWQNSFSQEASGKIIELTRSILLSFGAFYFIGLVWRKEALELIRGQYRITRLWRLIFLAIGIITFLLSLYYHLWLGPSKLQLNYDTQKDIFRNFFVPYIAYLPYTLVNYNVLALSWVAVSSYGAFMDLNKNLARTNKFIERLNSIQDTITHSQGEKARTIEEFVDNEFSKFSTNLITLVSRYTVLVLAISIIIIFEVFWGAATLSKIAKELMSMTYGFSTLAFVSILWVFYHYHVAFRKASIVLLNAGCNHNKFEERNNFPNLVKRIFSSHLNLYIFVFLLVIIATLYFLRLILAS